VTPARQHPNMQLIDKERAIRERLLWWSVDTSTLAQQGRRGRPPCTFQDAGLAKL
jgi:hypothetical protein